MSDRENPPVPTFSGNYMPKNVTVNVDDDIVDETTRRIGGVGIMPSFNIQPIAFPTGMDNPSFRSEPLFSTTLQKASPQMAPRVVAQSLNEPVKVIGWKLYDAPVLPEFHPLERSAVFVPRSQALEVAQRISDVLRDRSISATYDNVKAKARCSTPEQVEFRIRLYRGRKQYSHGIIVEVQKRFGSCLSFHDDTTAILEAAEGKVPSPPPLTMDSLSRIPLPLVSDNEEDHEENEPSCSLEFVAKMLNFPSYDSHHLAMQTLVSLTDATKMGLNTARNVSTELLDVDSGIGAKVFSLVIDTSPDQEETFGLRVQAMTVVSNAVNTVHGNISTFLRERLRPALLNEMKTAEAHPQMAYLATKCLEPLIEGDHSPCELHNALEVARSVGESRHAALRRQAERCIHKIESR